MRGRLFIPGKLVAVMVPLLLMGGSCGPTLPETRYSFLPFGLSEGEEAKRLVGKGVQQRLAILETTKALSSFKSRSFDPLVAQGRYALSEERKLKANLRASLPAQVSAACGGRLGLDGDLSIASAGDIAIHWRKVLIPDACDWDRSSNCCPISDDPAEKSKQYGACGDFVITAIYETELVATASATTSLRIGGSISCTGPNAGYSVRAVDGNSVEIRSTGWNVASVEKLHVVCDSLRLAACQTPDPPPVTPPRPEPRPTYHLTWKSNWAKFAAKGETGKTGSCLNIAMADGDGLHSAKCRTRVTSDGRCEVQAISGDDPNKCHEVNEGEWGVESHSSSEKGAGTGCTFLNCRVSSATSSEATASARS